MHVHGSVVVHGVLRDDARSIDGRCMRRALIIDRFGVAVGSVVAVQRVVGDDMDGMRRSWRTATVMSWTRFVTLVDMHPRRSESRLVACCCLARLARGWFVCVNASNRRR